ncbi:hypothetical protein DICVIV_12698 [Dictyocaulus viviparus]|uniref:Uncharacterized protein n=1 Tax=Dictyocaulus viviparus TaxID=29172 RepID=A0A0D8XCE7_DICVI|nr:hypothetical protein DICVIV_12698 [Dictyocaulus viviparus]
MMSLTVDSCADLECCLHGRRCRFGLKQLNKEMRKCEDRNESDDAQSTQKEIPPRQEQALERLARQLRHVEAFAERRQKRREKREKRRAERRKKRVTSYQYPPDDTESQRSTETESNRIVDSSSSKQFMRPSVYHNQCLERSLKFPLQLNYRCIDSGQIGRVSRLKEVIKNSDFAYALQP